MTSRRHNIRALSNADTYLDGVQRVITTLENLDGEQSKRLAALQEKLSSLRETFNALCADIIQKD